MCGRAVIIGVGYRQVGAAGTDRGQVELSAGGGATRLENADGAICMLGRVLGREPGELIGWCVCVNRPGTTYRSRRRSVSALRARAGRYDIESWRYVCARHGHIE